MACVSVGIFVFLAVARGHHRLVSISILESVSGGWLVGSRDRQWCDTFDRMRADWIDPVVGALWGKKSAGIEVGKRQPGRSISLEWTEYEEETLHKSKTLDRALRCIALFVLPLVLVLSIAVLVLVLETI